MKQIIYTLLFCLIGYSSLLYFVPAPKEYVLQNTFQTNQYRVSNYISVKEHVDTVLVGSSLTQKLRFDHTRIYNMGLAGDSALTGLHSIIKLNEFPRQIYIEINVPPDSVNEALVKAISTNQILNLAIFHVENNPVNLIYSYLYQSKSKKQQIAFSAASRESALKFSQASYQKTLDDRYLNSNMKKLAQVVNTLKNKGVDVVFYELPIHTSLEKLPRALQIRKVFQDNFPNFKHVQAQEISNNIEFATEDGTHLAPDEAKLASDNLAHIILKN